MDDELVTVAHFNTTERAEAARQRLSAAGVFALILDHEPAPSTASTASALAATLGGVKLLVKAADEDRAVDALDRFARLPTEALADAEVPPPPSGDAVTTPENRDAVSESSEQSPGESDDSGEAEDEEDANVQTTDREVLAERTLRAQILSFVFPPLQLVTFVYLIQVATSKERLSEKPRQAFALALGLHIVLWVIAVIVWAVISGNARS